MIEIIADLPDEALVWQPAPDMGSLSGIICHSMYVETFAIRCAAGEDATENGGYLIAKAATHTTMHWGHMQMTRQRWEQMHPEFRGSYRRW